MSDKLLQIPSAALAFEKCLDSLKLSGSEKEVIGPILLYGFIEGSKYGSECIREQVIKILGSVSKCQHDFKERTDHTMRMESAGRWKCLVCNGVELG